MTTDEARYVWKHRHTYDAATVDYAVRILEAAGEL
jgi:hypothetical protein